jgi:hypothetical protein
MKNLSAKGNIKGELLQAFIGDIVKGGQGSSLYPTRKEMLEVVRICLSNFAASRDRLNK